MFLRVVAGIFVKWCRTCHSTQFCCNFCALWQRHELVDVAAGEYASQLLGLSRAVCASSARGARSACQCCPVCCFSFFVRFSVLCAMWCANVPPVRYAGKFWRLCSALLPGSVSQHAKLGMFLRVVAGIFVKWCRTCHSTQFCCNFCALWQRHELVDVAAGEYASQLLGLSRAVCASSARGGSLRLPVLSGVLLLFFCALRQRHLPHLFFADGGDEFLEVERFEVGYVLEVAGAVGCEGGGEHG